MIHLLTQSQPWIQRETIDTYFTRNASFTHPFCRTGSWDQSRFLIQAIYRWYKIMSPRIDLKVNSVGKLAYLRVEVKLTAYEAFDSANLILYVNISQVFRIWVIPFYRAPVSLVTVITLERNRDDGKYYIRSQNDLYQVDEFVRFLLPPGWILVWLWHFWATLFCVLGAIALWPVTIVEQWFGQERAPGRGEKDKGLVDGVQVGGLPSRSRVNR